MWLKLALIVITLVINLKAADRDIDVDCDGSLDWVFDMTIDGVFGDDRCQPIKVSNIIDPIISDPAKIIGPINIKIIFPIHLKPLFDLPSKLIDEQTDESRSLFDIVYEAQATFYEWCGGKFFYDKSNNYWSFNARAELYKLGYFDQVQKNIGTVYPDYQAPFNHIIKLIKYNNWYRKRCGTHLLNGRVMDEITLGSFLVKRRRLAYLKNPMDSILLDKYPLADLLYFASECLGFFTEIFEVGVRNVRDYNQVALESANYANQQKIIYNWFKEELIKTKEGLDWQFINPRNPQPCLSYWKILYLQKFIEKYVTFDEQNKPEYHLGAILIDDKIVFGGVGD